MLVGLIIFFVGILFLISAIIPSFVIDFGIVWPLILIVSVIFHTFSEKKFSGFSAIALFIGVWFLLVNTYVFERTYAEIFWPIILILIGINIIYTSTNVNKIKKSFFKPNEELQSFYGVFGGSSESIKNKDFKGANIYSVFGGVDLDLTDLSFKADSITLNVYSIFGGSEIRLPENCEVVFNSTAILASNENRYKAKASDKNKTVYINCCSIFGGSEIK